MNERKGNPMFSSIQVNDTEDYSSSYAATYTGVSIKTFILLGLVVLFGVIGVVAIPVNALFTMIIISPIVCLISALVGYRVPSAAMICGILYAIFQGVTLGVTTAIVDAAFPGIASSAIIATIATFTVMLFLYVTGVIRASSKFRAFIYTALLSILLVNLVILFTSLFTSSLVDVFYGNGAFALIIAVAVVVIAALSLIVDFANVTNLVEGGFDKRYEWTCALGLMVSIIYLYIQILRVLMIIASRANKD